MTTPGRFVLSAIDPVIQSNGSLANGAILNFWNTGTTNDATVYTDSTLTNPVVNPQVSNAGGRFYSQTREFWADSSVAYDLNLSMPDGETYFYPQVFLVAAPVDTSGFLQNPNVMLTGVPTAPTPAANDSSSKIATTAFVQAALSLLAIFPVGSELTFSTPVTISGWALEDGSAISRSANPGLFGMYGTTFGIGDGSTTFNLPNMVGYHPRGANPTGTGPGPVTAAGSTLMDAFQGHFHTHDASLVDTYGRAISGGGTGIPSGSGASEPPNVGAPVTDGVSGTPRTATETRVVALVKYWYVKLG